MKVLVVDDDQGSLLVAKAAVEQSGHQCLIAEDGDEAWKLYRSERPEAVVTDLEMPGLNGLELCRAIRDDGTDSYTYLVLVTSHRSRDDVLAGMQAGADDYVSKPLDPFTLHTRLLVASRVTSLHADLARYRVALAEQARTDPLTKLFNRLKLTEDLDELDNRSNRYGQDYCLALCDVDHFKSYNDLYGHPAGDKALQSVASALSAEVRRSDRVYRFGGEEFLLLLPHQSLAQAGILIERVRARVESLRIDHSGNPSGVLTISAGISASVQGKWTAGQRLLNDADLALYQAKAAGRNRVELTRAGH
ncbi:diguanylate cyclase [Arthrobacter sp. NPDC057013]|uniref:GGDEF domain-containing response regulator n=1 Tax=Arthrobacter sp. NPDC057013 TaxID=3345999 RepID=UPI00363019C4